MKPVELKIASGSENLSPGETTPRHSPDPRIRASDSIDDVASGFRQFFLG